MTSGGDAIPELDRRFNRAGGLALLIVGLGCVAQAIATTRWAWLLAAIWPALIGSLLVIAHKPGATRERVLRWLR